jgi:hypothetical protein
MPRPPIDRPLGEHLATLARVLRQIDVSTQLPDKSKTAVKEALAKAMRVVQEAVVTTTPPARLLRKRPVKAAVDRARIERDQEAKRVRDTVLW